MTDGKGLWTDILFESMIMASVLLSFSWSLFAVIQDLTSVVQFWRDHSHWIVFQRESVTQSEIIHKGWYFNSRWHKARSFTKDGISTVGDTERAHSHGMVFKRVSHTERDHSYWMIFQQAVTQSEIIHIVWYFKESRWHRARSFALDGILKTVGDTEWTHSQRMVFQQSVTQSELIRTGWYFKESLWHRARLFTRNGI